MNGEAARRPTRRLAIERIRLSAYRNYRRLDLAPGDRSVVLFGANGSGKTNLIEAVSLFVPGRGLRRARGEDLAARASDGATWTAHCRAATLEGPADLDLFAKPDGRRGLRLDGRPAPKNRLAALLAMLWLTPADDRLFVDRPERRRRFVDRATLALDPEHAERSAQWERGLGERVRVLRSSGDRRWLEAIEARMARAGAEIAAARGAALDALRRAAERAPSAFPAPRLAMAGELERWLEAGDRNTTEGRLRAALAAGRALDAERGGAGAGPHRSDLEAIDQESGEPASRCSTGRQKALLISVIIALAGVSAERLGAAPILLLDEIAAHLDPRRRSELFDALRAAGCQFWLTGTEAGLFEELRGEVASYHVEEGTVEAHG